MKKLIIIAAIAATLPSCKKCVTCERVVTTTTYTLTNGNMYNIQSTEATVTTDVCDNPKGIKAHEAAINQKTTVQISTNKYSVVETTSPPCKCN